VRRPLTRWRPLAHKVAKTSRKEAGWRVKKGKGKARIIHKIYWTVFPCAVLRERSGGNHGVSGRNLSVGKYRKRYRPLSPNAVAVAVPSRTLQLLSGHVVNRGT